MKIFGLLLVCISVVLCGCSVGPDYERPETVACEASGYVNQPTVVSDCNSVPARWWESFADDTTTKLVERSLENNQDIRAAAARYLQSEGAYKSAGGARLPQFNYEFNRNRSKSAIDLPGGLTNFLSTTNSHQISVSYVVDLFGKLKRAEAAAWNDLLASEYSREAIVHGIIAQTVIARTNIANINRQLEIAKSNTASWDSTYRIIERRYRNGVVGALDLRLARENLAASKANETAYEEMLREEELRLDVLLGVQPGSSAQLPELTADLPRLEDVPCDLPARLLDRRPDLRAAEMNLAAATERVGVNIANLYPDLTLTAATGFRSSNFDDLLNKDYEIYNLIFNAVQPIFRGGQLKAEVDISKARVEELSADYAKAILEALREVESALMREKILRERLAFLEERVTEAKASEDIARDRYLKGLEKLITVLETERRKRTAELEISRTLAEIWSTRVDLYLALGGDWSGEEKKVCSAKK